MIEIQRKSTLKGPEERRKAVFRAAFDFHARHSPPTIDREYWKDHTPGEDGPAPAETEYWIKTALDMNSTAQSLQQDPFLNALLIATYNELEREYKTALNGLQRP